MRFSIITVSYNHGRFIEKTIKSVISQRGDFYIEYLIIDGDSKDNTIEILKKYEKMLKNREIEINCNGIEFYWVSEPDNGPTEALNKGLKKAKGNIIGIINSDDFYLNEKVLEKVKNVFEKSPEVDVVYGDAYFIDENDNIIGEKKGFKKIDWNTLKAGAHVAQPGPFYKRSLFSRIGYMSEELKYTDDYEFWIRCVKNGIKFFYIPEFLLNFRVLPTARSYGSTPFIFIENLYLQIKNFGIRYILQKDKMVNSVFGYSQIAGVNIEESFLVIRDGLFRMLGEKISRKYINKVKGRIYIKKSIYEVFKNKKEGLKYYLRGFWISPSYFFTKDSIVFIMRLFLMREKFYFGIKDNIKKLLGLKK